MANLTAFFAEDMTHKWHFCNAQLRLVLVERNSVCFAPLKQCFQLPIVVNKSFIFGVSDTLYQDIVSNVKYSIQSL